MARNHETRLYLLRHGTTQWSASGRHTSHTDLDLTEHGEHLAVTAGRDFAEIPLVEPRVLTSPLRRARRTAELAGFDNAEDEPLLREWDYGDFEGMTTPQIREQVPEWTVWTHSCPNGESAEDVAKRCARLVERVRSGLSHGDVVLVGHGHFSRALIAAWLGLPVTSGVRFALETAGIVTLGHERGIGQLQGISAPRHT